MEGCNFGPYPDDGKLYCNATFDGVQCWNYTLAGSTAIGACPESHPYHHYFDNPEGYSYRKCETNGTHESVKLIYETCISPSTMNQSESNVDRPSVLRITSIYISGYALSILLLLTALVIFRNFRQLWCKRVIIHSNLFTSYILDGFAWVVIFTIPLVNPQGISDAWFFVAFYTTTCRYGWMLAEGVFLHFCLAEAFSNKKTLMKVCCIVGWVCPAFIMGIYCAVLFLEGDGTIISYLPKNMDYFWIIMVPIILSQLLNIIFLINIIRILRSKVYNRVNHRNSSRYKKIIRAMLILIPLLGLQNLSMAVKIDSVYYEYFVAVLQSYQGAVVAVLFCFLNREVLRVVKKRITTWRRLSGSFSRGSEKLSIMFHTRKSIVNQISSPDKQEPDPLL